MKMYRPLLTEHLAQIAEWNDPCTANDLGINLRNLGYQVELVSHGNLFVQNELLQPYEWNNEPVQAAGGRITRWRALSEELPEACSSFMTKRPRSVMKSLPSTKSTPAPTKTRIFPTLVSKRDLFDDSKGPDYIRMLCVSATLQKWIAISKILSTDIDSWKSRSISSCTYRLELHARVNRTDNVANVLFEADAPHLLVIQLRSFTASTIGNYRQVTTNPSIDLRLDTVTPCSIGFTRTGQVGVALT